MLGYKFLHNTYIYGNRGVVRGRGKFPLPETKKNCCRKMVLFPKALVLVTDFPKIVKNSNFLLNFHQKFSNFSQNFKTICIFRPNARKINAWFVKFLEKYAKIKHFRNFLKKFLKIFEDSPALGGPDPQRGRSPKVFLPEPKSWLPPCMETFRNKK